MKRNLLVDLLAGVLITITAIYDFSGPWCYGFIAFGILLILTDLNTIVNFKHSNASRTLRSKWIDITDIGLGCILAIDFWQWLGIASPWCWIALIGCAIIMFNGIYNLFETNNGKENRLKVFAVTVTDIFTELI